MFFLSLKINAQFFMFLHVIRVHVVAVCFTACPCVAQTGALELNVRRASTRARPHHFPAQTPRAKSPPDSNESAKMAAAPRSRKTTPPLDPPSNADHQLTTSPRSRSKATTSPPSSSATWRTTATPSTTSSPRWKTSSRNCPP